MAQPRYKPAGFTLLELLLVVGIAAVLIVSGIALYSQVNLESKINATINLIHTLVQKVHLLSTTYATYGPDGTSLTPLLVNSQSIPAKYITPDNEIVSPLSAVPLYLAVGRGGHIILIMTLPPAYIPKVALQFVTKPPTEIWMITVCNGTTFPIADPSTAMQTMINDCGASTDADANNPQSQLVLRFE